MEYECCLKKRNYEYVLIYDTFLIIDTIQNSIESRS
jgi:hypothetical protein